MFIFFDPLLYLLLEPRVICLESLWLWSCLTGNKKVGKLKKEEKYMYHTTYTYNNGSTPSAYLTVGKNRVKQYNNTVYMNDKQEFEIELFNPKNTSVLVKIKLNGNYISTRGIYLKPGQRIFLDRFIDNNNKFLFSTYEVGASNEVKKAIANNGDVEIEFYDEYIAPILTTNTFWYSSQPITNNCLNNPTVMTTTTNTLNNTSMVGQVRSRSLYSSSSNSSATMDSLESIETGRIEKGDVSNQSFTEVNGSFNTYYSTRTYWKIMPQSQEPVQYAAVQNYCTSCGTKIKKESYNFCPKCGNKLK